MQSNLIITDLEVKDIRFPTSKTLDGSDAITKEEAIALLAGKVDNKKEGTAQIKAKGYPAYTTSVGWLGYSDEKMRRLCRAAKAEGFSHLKMKVGANLADDMRRASIIREKIGDGLRLMMDANQKWDVDEAIEKL